MATHRSLRPVDVATGVISGGLAAAFLTLAVVAAVPDQPTTTVDVIGSAAPAGR
ncbi:hypothetical protein [Nocardioides litoris]|uniref:hypothetical protein n=1 Tax=Nocardioides litoris TaxID=1926648 RepID=UPI001476A067|nr:hypothetical protein [Nocardioides litoris]